MDRLQTFHTGFLVTASPFFPKGPYKGKGWRIFFRKDTRDILPVRNSSEVMIHASTRNTAQQVAHLVHGALVLIDADASYSQFNQWRSLVYSDTSNGLSGVPRDLPDSLKNYRLWTPDIPLACKVAVRVSFSRHYSYALTKYSLSCWVFSTPGIDLDPSNSPNIRLSSFFEDHVRLATAIFLAYSAIEELDLHLKASESKPSRNEKGEWNPEVRRELEQRLAKAGIDLHEPFLWSIRGPQRRIERKRPPKPLSRPLWGGWSVRDIYVNIVDALADASWLRSKVSAHGFSRLASSLSPYDVANVQHLARRLILETLGFWRYDERMLRKKKC
jgi:hypothetical protein